MSDLERLPARGDPSTLFSRLATYITPLDTSWPTRIAPADDGDIAEYIHVSGFAQQQRPLPTSVMSLWRHMGRNDGHMLWWLRATTSVRSLNDYYRSVAVMEPETLNPEAPVLATFLLSDQLSMDLRTTKTEPSVWTTSSGEFMEPFADSVDTLVCRLAFQRCEYLRFGYRTAYSASVNSMLFAIPRAHARHLVLRRLHGAGFDRCWFSDRTRFFGVRSDASVEFELLPNEGPLIAVYAHSNNVLSWLAPLANEIGATPVAIANMPT